MQTTLMMNRTHNKSMPYSLSWRRSKRIHDIQECKTPEGSFHDCTSCYETFYLLGNLCCNHYDKINDCGYYEDCWCKNCKPGLVPVGEFDCLPCETGKKAENEVCVDCGVEGCTSYSNGCNCSSCKPDYILRDGECQTCPKGQKIQGDICASCGVEHCREYSSGCTCGSCKSGYVLNNNNECVPCEAGKREENGRCVDCNVEYCREYSSGCTCRTCKENYIKDQSSCKLCPAGKLWFNETYCENCGDPHCIEYSNGCICRKCMKDAYVYNGKCMSCTGDKKFKRFNDDKYMGYEIFLAWFS